ncbi:hypothetical protein M513_13140 [Trichuris suis]|uniref:DUF4219 domain-containing protein n=1 Tax=Trichuris suis TaxID=68888 RepID=A0A085LLY8_9BILA|nr:hypothetical protein M513_13140 [Trichuris suis]
MPKRRKYNARAKKNASHAKPNNVVAAVVQKVGQSVACSAALPLSLNYSCFALGRRASLEYRIYPTGYGPRFRFNCALTLTVVGTLAFFSLTLTMSVAVGKDTITLLNGGNYMYWKAKVKAMLVRDDLWDVVSVFKPEVRTTA